MTLRVAVVVDGDSSGAQQAADGAAKAIGDVGNAAGQAAPKLDTLSKAHGGISTQAMSLQHAVRGSIEQIALGVSPTQALAAQLNHLSYAASGEGGLVGAFKGLGEALAPMFTLENLMALGLVGAGIAAAQLFSVMAGQQEAAAEAALKRQKDLIEDISKVLPGAGAALKAYLDIAKQLTPNQLVVATQQQITAAQNQLASLMSQIHAASFDNLSGGGRSGPTNVLAYISSDMRQQLQGWVHDLEQGHITATQVRDDIAGLQLAPDLDARTKAVLNDFSLLADKIGEAQVTAQAFTSTLDALRAGGGPIIAGDFGQLGGSTQKAFDALQSVIDSGTSEKDKLNKLVKQGIGGATSLDDQQHLKDLLAQADKVLDAKAAAASGKTSANAYGNATDSITKETEALTAQISTIGQSSEAIETNRIKQQLLTAAELDHVNLSPKAMAAIDQQAAAYGKAKAQLEELTKTYQDDKGAFVDFFTGLGSNIAQGENAFQALEDAGISAIDGLMQKIIEADASKAFDDLFGNLFGGGTGNLGVSVIGGALGHNAGGTNNWRGGLTSVNEQGGEIMNLPSGTQIIPHDVSMAMAGGGGDVHFHTAIDARGSTMTPAQFGAILAQRDSAIMDMFPAAYNHMRANPRATSVPK